MTTTEPITLQEGADLVVQAITSEPSEPLAASTAAKDRPSNEPSSPVAQKTESNRLQRRFDKLTRTIHEQREELELAQTRLLQEQKHAADLVAANSILQAENQQLLIDLKAATKLISQFRAELAHARGAKQNVR